MFHDYLARYPAGGTQHLAFRLPVGDFDRVAGDLREQGYAIISEVDHPIARMAFFDTYRTLGLATEIMGVTPLNVSYFSVINSVVAGCRVLITKQCK
ncbi:MAG: hypothetical protein P4L51_09665 [Puia sp.]|nr:hypothetical protein [Puia sp.]